MREPPEFLLLGPAENTDFQEEMRLKYPLVQDHYPYTIAARHGLGLIMNNIIFNVWNRAVESEAFTTGEACSACGTTAYHRLCGRRT